MKPLYLLAAVCAFAATHAHAAEWGLASGACAPRDGVAAVELRFSNVRAAEGSLIVTAYGDRAADFLAKGKKLAKLAVAAQAGAFAACLELPAPGVYALTVFHDADGSGRLSRNFLGLPVEGYGFPNDPATLLAPPGFEQVALRFEAGVTSLPIVLHYP